MKKITNKRNINFIKFFDKRNLGSIPRVFLCSLAVIFFFYSMPLIIEFTKMQDNAFQNNSKKF